MGNNKEESNVGVLENRHNLLSRVDSSQLNELQLSSIMQNVTISTETLVPDIRINPSTNLTPKKFPPNTLPLEKRNLSRSSAEVDGTEYICDPLGESSEIPTNITQSQSESALKNIANPFGNATKEMVLSPLTKFAKGVQNIGANFDPRKLGTQVRYVSERDMEEHRKLQEKWQNSKSRLVAL